MACVRQNEVISIAILCRQLVWKAVTSSIWCNSIAVGASRKLAVRIHSQNCTNDEFVMMNNIL